MDARLEGRDEHAEGAKMRGAEAGGANGGAGRCETNVHVQAACFVDDEFDVVVFSQGMEDAADFGDAFRRLGWRC